MRRRWKGAGESMASGTILLGKRCSWIWNGGLSGQNLVRSDQGRAIVRASGKTISADQGTTGGRATDQHPQRGHLVLKSRRQCNAVRSRPAIGYHLRFSYTHDTAFENCTHVQCGLYLPGYSTTPQPLIIHTAHRRPRATLVAASYSTRI